MPGMPVPPGRSIPARHAGSPPQPRPDVRCAAAHRGSAARRPAGSSPGPPAGGSVPSPGEPEHGRYRPEDLLARNLRLATRPVGEGDRQLDDGEPRALAASQELHQCGVSRRPERARDEKLERANTVATEAAGAVVCPKPEDLPRDEVRARAQHALAVTPPRDRAPRN